MERTDTFLTKFRDDMAFGPGVVNTVVVTYPTMAPVTVRDSMRAMVREAEDLVRWCFEGAPPAFRFVYARMGQMVEGPPRGELRAEPTANNIQRGSASYSDVADAFVRLAGDAARTWERKAIYFNYA